MKTALKEIILSQVGAKFIMLKIILRYILVSTHLAIYA